MDKIIIPDNMADVSISVVEREGQIYVLFIKGENEYLTSLSGVMLRHNGFSLEEVRAFTEFIELNKYAIELKLHRRGM